jgi:hypothetical protein
MQDISVLVGNLVVQFPWLATFFMVVGVIRIVVKPLMALIKSVVEATPSKADDELVAKVEQNAIYKGFVFVIDWLFSIKPVKV